MKKISGILLVGLFSLLIGCENPDDNSIAMAQRCLDTATPGTAANCAALVNGINKAEAWGIKCAADFIADGITTTRIVNAVTNMTNGVTGASNSAGVLMLYISFSSNAVASTAMSDCTNSGSKGYIFFASAAQMGAAVNAISGGGILTTINSGGTPTGAQIQNAINTAATSNNAATQTAVGNAAINLYSTQCAVLTAQNTSACKTIQAAVASSSNPQTVGQTVLNALLNPPPQ